MCGICGIVHHEDESMQHYVNEMNKLQHKRGPDGRGVRDIKVADFYCTFGHTRLSIIDHDGGAQPMIVENETMLVFNGEIYNYLSLRKELEVAGTVFRSRSDTEVVLHGYRVWGIEGLLKKIDGMFAFAVADQRNGRIVLARDPAGQKPLYFSRSKGNSCFAFASTLRALTSLPWFDFDINRTALELFLNLRVVPAPYSIYRNTFKLSPGCYLVFDGRTDFLKEFWSPFDINIRGDYYSERELLDEYRFVLKSSLQQTLTADVPVSLLLSSGVDSTSLALELGSLPDRADVTAYTVAVQGAGYDESTGAKAAARSIGLKHEVLEFYGTSMENELNTFGDIIDEPFGDPSILPSIRLCRTVADKARVAITGDGADELFGGYPTFNILSCWPFLKRFSPLIKPLCTAGQYFLSWSDKPHSLDMKLRRLSHGFAYDGSMSFASWLCIFSPKEAAELLGNKTSDVFPTFASDQICSTQLDPVSMMCRLYFRLFLPGVLEKMDRAAMHFSLETRTPFLQRRMMEFAFSLPPRFKVHRGVTKYLMRKSLSNNLPRGIAYSPKKGFLPPMGALFSHMRDPDMTAFLLEACDNFGIDKIKIMGLIRDHNCGRRNVSEQLWLIFVLGMFLRNSRLTATH